MLTMRLIQSDALPAPLQMALDEAIARSVRAGRTPPTLRLYTWERPAFTIGSFQRLEETFDLEACRRAGIAIVRRLTGGRAVYHDQDVTYALAARADHPLVKGGARAAFRAVGRAFIAGLKTLGLEADLCEPCKPLPRPAGLSPLCLLVATGYDVKVRGKKLIGSAQRRWPDGALLQGSLPLVYNPRGFLPFLRPSLSLHEVMAAGTSLTELLDQPDQPGRPGREVRPDEVMAAIRDGIEASLDVRLIEAEPTADERATALALAAQRYASLL